MSAAAQQPFPALEPFVPADQAARDRIREDLAANLCVEAGAGTGKTTVLVSRIVELLRRGFASIDEIAVITFTEKAAAELVARVREELEKARAATDCPAEERERLHRALLGLHRARIETIHAFAANLLRERPVEAGLDPGFEVLQGVAGGLAFEDAYDEWIERLFGGSGEDADLLRRVLNRSFDLKQVRDAVDAVHRHRYALPLVRFPRVVHADVEEFVGEVERIARDLEAAGGGCHNHADLGFAQIASVTAFRDELVRSRGDRARVERVIFERHPAPNTGLGSRGNFRSPGDCDRMKESFKEIRELIEQTHKALRAEALAEFLPLAEKFVEEFERRRRADGRADFDDLLLWARDLLRDKPEVRAYFQRRFRCVLVDEFQDTDPIQAELIVYIASDVTGDEAPDGDWLDLALRPGALFVVGDPKQSIYRFRRADMAIYDAVKKGPLAGEVVELTQNFRSLEGLIGWVNGAFDHLFVAKEGVQPRNTPLEAAPSGLALPRSPVVVVHGTEVAENQHALREDEARTLGAIIKRAVEEERWQVRDPRSGEPRASRFADVAVLVPSRTEIDLYEDAFVDAGLPFRHEGNRSFYQRQEVTELAACLEAIDDPSDRLNLVTALRSSAFACSDEELFLFVADDGKFDYFRPVPNGHEGIAAAFSLLRELHRVRRKLGLPELVHRLISRTHWAELALTIPQGEQAAANLLKVVDQARAFAGAANGGLRAFARWLESGRDPETSEEEEASVMEETDDVVRLLTIHHAKGLEFPIVALANLNVQDSHQRYPFLDPESGRLHVNAVYGFKTPGFEEDWQAEADHNEAERMRLLYVACTRARDHLIVPVIEKDWRGGFEGMMERLLPYLPGWQAESAGQDVEGCYVYDPALLLAGGNGRVNGKAPTPSEADIQAALAAREEWIEERERVLAEASRGLSVQTATRDRTDEEPPERGESSDAAESLDRPDHPARVWTRRSKAARIGSALHKVMEKVDLLEANNLEPLARAVCIEAGVPGHVDEVIQIAHNCLASPAVRRAIASGSHSREASFAAFSRYSGVSTGRVDLFFNESNEGVIIDFKSDQVTEEEVGQRMSEYGDQARAYATAVSASTRVVVRQVVFVFARLGTERSIAL